MLHNAQTTSHDARKPGLNVNLTALSKIDEKKNAKVISTFSLEQGAKEIESCVASFMFGTDGDLRENLEIGDKYKFTSRADHKLAYSKDPVQKDLSNSLAEGLSLTDEDLIILLRDFSDLTPDEQTNLSSYLSKIEQSNPVRVESLRKYINIGDPETDVNSSNAAKVNRFGNNKSVTNRIDKSKIIEDNFESQCFSRDHICSAKNQMVPQRSVPQAAIPCHSFATDESDFTRIFSNPSHTVPFIVNMRVTPGKNSPKSILALNKSKHGKRHVPEDQEDDSFLDHIHKEKKQ